jgi:hypothetical protein
MNLAKLFHGGIVASHSCTFCAMIRKVHLYGKTCSYFFRTMNGLRRNRRCYEIQLLVSNEINTENCLTEG